MYTVGITKLSRYRLTVSQRDHGFPMLALKQPDSMLNSTCYLCPLCERISPVCDPLVRSSWYLSGRENNVVAPLAGARPHRGRNVVAPTCSINRIADVPPAHAKRLRPTVRGTVSSVAIAARLPGARPHSRLLQQNLSTQVAGVLNSCTYLSERSFYHGSITHIACRRRRGDNHDHG
jgi:hypothetical protein